MLYKVRKTYEEWRATVPWTNQQIADTIRGMIPSAHSESHIARQKRFYDLWARHLEKTGRLSSKMLGAALPYLVTTCELCERKALYRLGNVGRCSKHRDVKDAATERSKALRNYFHGEIVSDANERDSLLRQRWRARVFSSSRVHRSKA